MSKSVSEQLIFEQIFDKHYDNTNKICTRRSLLEQFKQVNNEWLQHKEFSKPLVELDGVDIIKELVEDLEK